MYSVNRYLHGVVRSFEHSPLTRVSVYPVLAVLVILGFAFSILGGVTSPAALAAASPPAGLYLSSTTGGTLPVAGSFADEDILRYDEATGTWSIFFDGSDVGLGAVDVDAFEILPNGDILLSPDVAVTLPVVGAVDDSDIVRFVPTSTGTTTAGTYSLYFDGSDVGLTADGADIDGLAFAPNGKLLISVINSVTVPGISTSNLDEDLIAFAMTSQGPNTAGTWSVYFDGSDVGLATTTAEDINGVWSDPDTGQLYLSTIGNFAVPGVSGQASDVFVCSSGTFGATTSCTFSLFWDGATHSFGTEVIDGFSRVIGTQATATPTSESIHTPTSTAVGSTITPSNTPPPGIDKILYLSSTTGGTVSGVSFADEDILRYNPGSGSWELFFDGSDVGLGGTDVDAFEVLPNGDILLSTDTAVNLPVIGSVDDSDIVRFKSSSTGANTAGSYTLYFDGSDVALTTDGEDVDGIAFAPDGRLLISVITSATVTGLSTQALDEDLLAFTMTAEGSITAGSWDWYFDGSDVALNTSSSEDINGVWSDPDSGVLYLSTIGNFAVAGLKGQASDVFACRPGSYGATTACTFSLFWDGAVYGFGPEVIDGLTLVVASSPPPTETNTPPPTETHTPPPTETNTPMPTETHTPPPTETNTPPPTETNTPPPTETNTPMPTPSGPRFINCVSNTGDNATIGIPGNITLVNGPTLETDDEVAIFTADGSICAGMTIWTGENIAITAWGDNSITTEKDGLGADEVMQFHIWDRSAGVEYVASNVSCIKVPGTATCAYVGGGIYQVTQINFPVTQSIWHDWVAYLRRVLN